MRLKEQNNLQEFHVLEFSESFSTIPSFASPPYKNPQQNQTHRWQNR